MAGERLTPVIMCGGAGTRLWPVSRESMPKQFVPLIGDRSTFQQTLARVSDPDLFERPIVITNGDFRFIVAEQLRELGIEADIVLEPSRRDSGPAVAVAAALAMRRDPPATNYGYIRPGAKLNGAATLAVEAFVEKPDAATATRYLAENYLWNSGNFTFRASVMLDEIERFEPEMADAARAAVAGMTSDLDFTRLAAEPFARAPKKSIDYAVMERTKLAAVVPADIGWTDIGSWDAVWAELDHDADGNATSGPTVMLGSRNSLVRA